MRLISLELREWRAYERCTIEFPDGLIGVSGSNGAGKSTMTEAIGWTLFGKLRPGSTVGDLRRQGGSGRPTTELVFQLGDALYTVRRTAGGDCRLWIGDPEGEPEAAGATNVSRRIVQDLDLTWDVFKRSVFAEQKDVAALDPSATGPSRRAHVERLLGLTRFKRAADQARAAVKAIQNEITGRTADLEDEATVEAELAETERAAEAASPRVGRIQEELALAEVSYKKAREHVEAEHGRAKEAARLQERRDAAAAAADAAESRVIDLIAAIQARDARVQQLSDIEPEARQAPVAEQALRALDALAEAASDLEDARAVLTSIDHDPAVATADSDRLDELQPAAEKLRASTLRSEHERLERRRDALAEADAAGDPDQRRATCEQFKKEERRLDRELDRLQRKLEDDRQHVVEVRQGGPDTPCPVCRKPYGDAYEEILAEHARAIATAEDTLPALREAFDTASAARKDAERRHDRARDAAKALAQTDGPATPRECEHLLAARQKQLTAEAERLRAIEAELPALRARVQAARERAAAWSSAQAVVDERELRFEKAAAAADCATYSPQAHAEARARSEHLANLAAEADELRDRIAEARTLEAQRDEAHIATGRQRAAAESHAKGLAELGVKEGRLEELQTQCALREAHRDDLLKTLYDARMEAQEQDQRVAEVRRRLAALRDALAEVTRRRQDLRRHQVAAEILDAFREHESQRAWPQLQQGASALLAAASAGRCADIRLSHDYKLTIVDRGEEHGLARYSGGEQDLANLCLRLAIAEWVAKERGTDISLVILDEVFGSQDEERRRLLLEQLRSLSSRFRQMLIVTHLPDIAELCDGRIEVSVSETGASTAIVAT